MSDQYIEDNKTYIVIPFLGHDSKSFWGIGEVCAKELATIINFTRNIEKISVNLKEYGDLEFDRLSLYFHLTAFDYRAFPELDPLSTKPFVIKPDDLDAERLNKRERDTCSSSVSILQNKYIIFNLEISDEALLESDCYHLDTIDKLRYELLSNLENFIKEG